MILQEVSLAVVPPFLEIAILPAAAIGVEPHPSVKPALIELFQLLTSKIYVRGAPLNVMAGENDSNT